MGDTWQAERGSRRLPARRPALGVSQGGAEGYHLS